jgi:micrococcal nuclease
MKKIFRIISVFLFFCIALSCVYSDNARADTIVYVTKSGTKYHRDSCRTLGNSKSAIKLADAVHAGYAPCAVCKPPELGEIGAALASSDSRIYRVNLARLTSYTQADITKMIPAKVVKHVDGDTVQIEIDNPPPPLGQSEKIRMIGVDTPETVHPKKEVEYFGKEASDYTKKALLGKPVYIALDWDTRDKYGRLLAYIYTADGKCHNAELVKQGYAHAYTYFPFQFLDEFRLLEQEARSAKRGLWR